MAHFVLAQGAHQATNNDIFHNQYNQLAVLRRSVQRVCSARLRFIAIGNTALFKEMSQWWQAVGNIVSDLTG